jgi:hypothetical protein
MFVTRLHISVVQEYFPTKPTYRSFDLGRNSNDTTLSKKYVFLLCKESDLVLLRLSNIKFEAVGPIAKLKASAFCHEINAVSHMQYNSQRHLDHLEIISPAINQLEEKKEQLNALLQEMQNIINPVLSNLGLSTNPVGINPDQYVEHLQKTLQSSGPAAFSKNKNERIIKLRQFLGKYPYMSK